MKIFHHAVALAALVSLVCVSTYAEQEKPFVIVIPSYNNAQWYDRNLDSVFKQRYKNFRVIYINDCSEDDTEELVLDYINSNDHQFDIQYRANKTRRGALANLYDAIHSCEDHEIVITLDGDDWLAHADALYTLNKIYQSFVVVTYGTLIGHPTTKWGICQEYPAAVVAQNAFRRYTWYAGHPRTFYAGLFKQIKKEDLIIDDEFFPAAWDVAIMLPLLEMAGAHHAYVKNVLYVYNIANPINDYKVHRKSMQQCYDIIMKRSPYQPLSEQELRAICKVDAGK